MLGSKRPVLKPAMVLLLVLLIGMLAPVASANMSLFLNPPTTNLQPIRVLSSTADGIAFELAVPWEELTLEPVTADGKQYVRASLPGWSVTASAGAPALPFAAETIAAPHGATVTVRVTPGKAHTVALPTLPLPAAAQLVEWDPPAGDAAPALPEPTMVMEEDPAIYAGEAAYPATLAEIASDGLLRQQRMVGIATYPVQYDPTAQALMVYESLRVEVAFKNAASAETLRQAPAQDSAAYEEFFRGKLLNYDASRNWRSSAPPSVEAAAAGIDATPWTPPAPGWRVTVQRDGFYKLTYGELQEAGLPVTTVVPSTFKLYNLGSEIAIHEEGDGDSQFETGESLVFYGQAIASKYAVDNVYWLTYGGVAGLRMTARDGTPGTAEIPGSHTAERHMEGNAYYLSFTPGDENLERWLWDYIYRPSRPNWTHTFTLAAPYAGPAKLTLKLLGYLQIAAVNPDHHARVTLNGTQVGDVTWDGVAWQVLEMAVPAGVLIAGTNTLVVTAIADTGYEYDTFYIDWTRLEFPNTYTAEGSELAFSYGTAGTWKYQVAGFTSSQASNYAVYDVTDPAAVKRITGIAVIPSGSGYAVQFQDAVAQGERNGYWVMANTAYRTVQAETSIEADTASNLRTTANAADHIIITHEDFLSQASMLRDYRAAQGLRAMAVDVQDVYDEFGYGLVSPMAIRDFLAYAYSQWIVPKPSYVVLLGDGHYDPKNYAFARASHIPPYLAPVDPWIGETAADNRYVTVDGTDTLPDMMLGRLAVNSAAEASAFVNKIIAYEASSAGDWQQRVLAVADNADSGGSFNLMSDNLLATHLPEPYQAQKVYYKVTHTDPTLARSAIQAGINAGALIVNYIGHGYTQGWATEDLLTTADVTASPPLLQNAGKLPVVLGMDCREGYYIAPDPLTSGREALAEVITRSDGIGAVASWSPTGLGVATGHDHLNRGFFDAVFATHMGTVGAGTAAGKARLFATGSNLDLLDTFLLFGDPATRLPTECVIPPAVSHLYIALASSTQVRLDWSAVPGALNYQVWWNATDPYFTPGGSCTEAAGCAWTSAASFPHEAGLGNTGVNNSYLVLPASACGAVQGTSNRVGEFDFALVPGN